VSLNGHPYHPGAWPDLDACRRWLEGYRASLRAAPRPPGVSRLVDHLVESCADDEPSLAVALALLAELRLAGLAAPARDRLLQLCRGQEDLRRFAGSLLRERETEPDQSIESCEGK
jgi:hypothetical protein